MSMQLAIFVWLIAGLCALCFALSTYPEETFALIGLAAIGGALWSIAGFLAEVVA